MGEKIALCHHEHWDGGGYPTRISGDEIPLEGRICAVVDFFDALTMDRPYRAAVPIEAVIEMMEELTGSHFDPDVYDAFLSVRDEVEAVQLGL